MYNQKLLILNNLKKIKAANELITEEEKIKEIDWKSISEFKWIWKSTIDKLFSAWIKNIEQLRVYNDIEKLITNPLALKAVKNLISEN